MKLFTNFAVTPISEYLSFEDSHEMKWKRSASVVITTLFPLTSGLSTCGATARSSVLEPINLRVESLSTPVGIESDRPRFSWTFEATDPNARAMSQTAYRVIVASSAELLNKDRGDAWDSG